MSIYSFETLSPTAFLLIWKIEEDLYAFFFFQTLSMYSKERMRQSISVRFKIGLILPATKAKLTYKYPF
jgi:hypothetical protein